MPEYRVRSRGGREIATAPDRAGARLAVRTTFEEAHGYRRYGLVIEVRRRGEWRWFEDADWDGEQQLVVYTTVQGRR